MYIVFVSIKVTSKVYKIVRDIFPVFQNYFTHIIFNMIACLSNSAFIAFNVVFLLCCPYKVEACRHYNNSPFVINICYYI